MAIMCSEARGDGAGLSRRWQRMVGSRMVGVLAFAIAVMSATTVQAREVCTIVADQASGQVLLERGDCRTRVTPASTFKVALAAMGFDAGLLQSPGRPVHAPREGDPTWGGAPWRRASTPVDWMEHSIVWYSRRITHAMGRDALERYARRFGFGNADLSGDAGFGNGLDRAWIASSLRVSPAEQVAFLRDLRSGALELSRDAARNTLSIVPTVRTAGWTLRGKTGSAYPRRADRSFDRARGYGWYVGWADGGGRTLVFARLNQDTQRTEGSPGNRARDGFVREWQGIENQLQR